MENGRSRTKWKGNGATNGSSGKGTPAVRRNNGLKEGQRKSMSRKGLQLKKNLGPHRNRWARKDLKEGPQQQLLAMRLPEGLHFTQSTGLGSLTGILSSRKEGGRNPEKTGNNEGPIFNNPDVQARKEQGLKEGFPEHPQEKQTVGSYKWRLMKEREKEMLEDERKIMLERKQLQEERAAFLAEREGFLEQREKREASIPRNVRLVSVRPERRPNPYKRERRTRRRRRREEASEEESEGERPERRPNSGESSKKDDEPQENEKEEEKEIKEEQQKQDQESSSGTEESLETPKCVPPVEKPEEKDEKMKNEKLENEPEAMQIDPKDL